MGDGTRENPYTREDVLRLIEENGGAAEGLDLSGKVFEVGIDLQGQDLKGIILRDTIFLRNAHLEEAYLVGAHFEGAFLNGAHLEKAVLVDAHLEDAQLWEAHLEGARLGNAHFEGAFLRHAYLDGARLENINWGNFILFEEKNKLFLYAEHIYTRLKQLHTEYGIYNTAGEFFFREMEAKRKNLTWLQPRERRWLEWWPLRGEKVRLNIYKWLYGYGERPWRVLAWAVLVVVGLALIYFAIGDLMPNTFLNSLYYSAVSFTALGYGSWAPEVTGWVKGLGAFEAFLGVFMIALFLVTFTRKMTR